MQKQVIILNGMARSGKQEVYNILNSKIPCEQYSIVDPVRDFLKRVGVPDNAKSEEWRKLMSDIKLLLEAYGDIPYQCCREKILDFLRCSPAKFLCIDMREEQDISRAREEFGAIIVLVRRNGVKTIDSNPADANVYNIKYDYTILNNEGFNKLTKEVDCFIEWIADYKCSGVVNSYCLKLDCKHCMDDDGGLYCRR